MFTEFSARGFTDADPSFSPHATERHGFHKLKKDGELFFGKYAKDHTNSLIAVDVWWCKTVQQLREEHSVKLYAPEIVAHGPHWYIAKWLDAKPSVDIRGSAAELDDSIHLYADYLTAIDSVKSEWIPNDIPPEAHNSTPYNNLDKHWAKWSARPLEEGILTQAQLEQAKQLLTDYQSYVQPSFQHGDFTPWHVLTNGQNHWWVVDGEHASIVKPRYYDLAYIYSRVFTHLHSPTHAVTITQAFMRQSNISPEALFPALLPVLTTRAIGMHIDALNTLHETDYRPDAQELLARCLSRDPQAIFTA